MFRVPEKCRLKLPKGQQGYSEESYGNNGIFIINKGKKRIDCIASDGGGWDHVSVNLHSNKRTPTWKEMCEIKNLFWGLEDCVMQFHPPQSEYVNIRSTCLHLWRNQNIETQTPPKAFV
jgi:hypothetical protein